ncbi:DUF6118 family protein [Novosphingobium album (ex Liu et al. 2023)]|uniref:DUF6118 family protein n=1 Tax=Novosphingobium album (ex Liu et al. 2023) TaxID=3031130 RepID=A0ABT5WQ99_9SPHN|nr:DUF6118 family protein [Novosphingobium album (ex Liu et al. 2023)]MDE8651462.1 DUF6118 family protein [Novosphingobium album (ex Liu et al. 2023)]
MGEDDGFDDADDPTQAFARVEDRLASVHGEVTLLRAAIEGLTAARENIEIPDYEPTLERTEKILVALAQRIDPIAKSPALAMTPDNMAGQIASAATAARREDARLVAEARSALDQTTRELGNRLASARRGDEQNRWLYLFGGGGLVLGMLLWAALAGFVARTMPTSWHWPERMATRTLAAPTMWDAGRHLMMTDSPDTWAGVVAAVKLAGDNREPIDACRRSATRAKKPVRCTIEVKAGE